jgi:hypothetical protein
VLRTVRHAAARRREGARADQSAVAVEATLPLGDLALCELGSGRVIQWSRDGTVDVAVSLGPVGEPPRCARPVAPRSQPAVRGSAIGWLDVEVGWKAATGVVPHGVHLKRRDNSALPIHDDKGEVGQRERAHHGFDRGGSDPALPPRNRRLGHPEHPSQVSLAHVRQPASTQEVTNGVDGSASSQEDGSPAPAVSTRERIHWGTSAALGPQRSAWSKSQDAH